ncbi:N1R/p28-like protein [Adoxophyes honmai entomopoxvirus 'L']|uniref:N1R/p28-like protein n=1 Tax=Adoxophyes honmai entomopoxvirus 'L' TaxID=1293540 RepID=A0A916KP26_9POXV|nr:N1R/p28-like protein [Adoxophyes honmai entomopoxvirus 'L']CCU55451.1 N1R/p28-like protein [Adoxophyes honmai entomopoxvirus 'L']
MSLNDICYEQIKDSFHYGLFGGFKLVIDKTNGYFNATKLCKDGGKRFKHWNENDKSKEIIIYVRNFLQSRNSVLANDDIIYEEKKTNNKLDIDKIITGTYVHKLLLLNISLWISNEFYLKCYTIIEKYYIDEYTTEYKEDKNKLNGKIKEIEKNIEDKNNVITSLENSIKDLNITLNNVKPKIITPPSHNSMYSTFTIIKLYFENKKDDYNYYITTVCNRDYYIKINNLRILYPELSIVLKLVRVPNSKYLLDNIKNDTIKNVEYNKNKFNLIDVNINEFINTIMEIKESIE